MSNAKVASPHDRLAALDRLGDSYTVQFTLLSEPGVWQRRDVLHHSERWLCVTPINAPQSEQVWIAMAAIAQLIIEEL